MQDVGPSGRELYFHLFAIGAKHDETHLRCTFFSLFYVDIDAEKSVNVADLDLETVIVKLWCDFTLFWLSLVGYLDLLNSEAIVRGAVLAELGSKNCETNLTLHEVGARYLNEHILGVEADFGLLTVYDRGQRQHLPILVIEDRVLIKTIQDWDELLHLHV